MQGKNGCRRRSDRSLPADPVPRFDARNGGVTPVRRLPLFDPAVLVSSIHRAGRESGVVVGPVDLTLGQFVDLKLEVQPEVRLRDEIGLRLSMEVISLVSSIENNNGSLVYQSGSRSVRSVLRLKDGETQVLTGLISDEHRSIRHR